MTDYLDKAATAAACVAGGVTEAIKDASASGAIAAAATAISLPAATTETLAATAYMASISPPGEAIAVVGLTAAVGGALYGAVQGCREEMQQQDQKRALDEVAKRVGASNLPDDQKLLRIQEAAKYLATPDQQLDPGRSH